MGFTEDLAEDMDEIFFDEDFFGTKHKFDGRELVVIEDVEELEEIKKRQNEEKWKDGVNKAGVLLFVRESDMERKLTVNSVVEYDDKVLYVNAIWKQPGIWKMLLGRNQV